MVTSFKVTKYDLDTLVLLFSLTGFFNSLTISSGPGSPHYRRSTITLKHTTLGRTSVEEWSARRRGLYLTTHNAHKRQTSKPTAGFESAIPVSEWSHSLAIDCAATGIGTIGGDANMNNSGGCKQIYVTLRLAWQLPALLVEEKGYDFKAFEWPWTTTVIPDWLESHLFISWTKNGMILRPTSGREWKLTSPLKSKAHRPEVKSGIMHKTPHFS
jgi:hypothetical protein